MKGTYGLPSDPETQLVLIHVTERMVNSKICILEKKTGTNINGKEQTQNAAKRVCFLR